MYHFKLWLGGLLLLMGLFSVAGFNAHNRVPLTITNLVWFVLTVLALVGGAFLMAASEGSDEDE